MVYMTRTKDGFHGHYDNLKTNIRYTFDAPGRTKKQIIKTFWDAAKNYNKQEVGSHG
ncbi:hypothetical protein HWC53_gp093 [Bacillus phage vB_BmeM-Goe8]|uniref:Uncharacterized protein n=1 Tax=Bacillus phage vB_BmeM-Goe8 TaxID=2593638 RepID=A0A516KN37_9CAUD|nr:hypothetical protein HWC53_gp093 [Bacillus phage vB_BmeM-Goe8]QDP42996.1 hypothetical protein Goe8_c02230 [Bacillus phage vB_BmeM-Goe8]